jgi:hypothetical protein
MLATPSPTPGKAARAGPFRAREVTSGSHFTSRTGQSQRIAAL